MKYLVPFKPTPYKYRSRPTPPSNVPELIDGVPQWEVEAILDEKETRTNQMFLVKWAHWNNQQQWLPMHCLTNCCQMIEDFYENSNLATPAHVVRFLYANRQHPNNTRYNQVDSPQNDVVAQDSSSSSDDDDFDV